MKKTTIAILSLLLISVTTTIAQGTINFGNRLTAATFAPVTMPDGTTRLDGVGYSAQLFLAGSLAAIGSPLAFRTGTGAGSWAAVELAVPGVAAGATASFIVRAWANGGGTYATYDAAVAAGQLAGESVAFTSLPLGGPTTPFPTLTPNIVGNTDPANNLQPFSLVVPEPSTIALGVIGAVALLLRRRK
jgi:PEP-CTERM motif